MLKSILLIFPPLWIGLNLFLLAPLFGLQGDETTLLQLAFIWIPILFNATVFPILRRRFEKEADMDAAKYAGKDAIISALEKLSDLGLFPKEVSRLWGLHHPSISQRINYIQNTEMKKN